MSRSPNRLLISTAWVRITKLSHHRAEIAAAVIESCSLTWTMLSVTIALFWQLSSCVCSSGETLMPLLFTAQTTSSHHGYEQWPWRWQAGVLRWRTDLQSHKHYFFHHHKRLGWCFSQRCEEWWNSARERGSSPKTKPVWTEALSAGERHLPFLGLWRGLHAHFPSSGSQADCGV